MTDPTLDTYALRAIHLEQCGLRAEARAIRELVAEVRNCRAIIRSLSLGDCWCGLAIDNPMAIDGRSAACVAARKAVGR